MATNPNITVLDKDGNPIDDRQIEVNGLLPGEGGGGESYWLLDNGTLVPEGSVSELDLSNIVAQVAEPTADIHAARKTDVDAVGDQVNNLSAGDVGAIPTDEKGAASGVATLDSDGDLDTGQVPSIVITDVYVIATESELTGLDANQGDVGIATDEQGSWILASDDPSVADNWKELKTDAPPVQEVFGRTGSITAQEDDYADHYAPLEEGVARGPIADRPTSGPYDDYLYKATDQGVTWRWDETAQDWSVFGHGSESQPVPEGHYDSLSTGDLTFDGDIGFDRQLSRWGDGKTVVSSTQVSTSEVAITEDLSNLNRVVVFGRSGGTDGFIDRIVTSRWDSSVSADETDVGSPPTRSYDKDGTSNTLYMSVGSGVANVIVLFDGAIVDQP